MSMEEFGDLFFVARDVRQKDFELLRHRAKHIRRYASKTIDSRALGIRCGRSPAVAVLHFKNFQESSPGALQLYD
jgi:hypothetical protein